MRINKKNGKLLNMVSITTVVLQACRIVPYGAVLLSGHIVFFKHISRKLLDIMMGFEAGVMIAASFGPS